MEFHSPSFKGKASLHPDATYDEAKDLVPREFVEQKANGMVVVRDVIPSNSDAGIVGIKEFRKNTIPANFALESCITDTTQIRVMLECEPDRTSFAVAITVNGQPATLDSVPGNSRLYTGYCDLTIDGDADIVPITVESETGESYTVNVKPMIGGPEITSAQVDALPEGQTHVKAGDTVTVSGVVANDAVKVTAVSGGAVRSVKLLTRGADDSAGEGYATFTGEISISDITTDAPITIVAENFLGTKSDPFNTADVPIDQQYPEIPNPTYAYPDGQTALKDGEQVGITCAIQHADTVQYAVHNGFTVNLPDQYEETKQVTLTAGESYSVDNQYYIVTAKRAANGAMATKRFTIDVANSAPIINLMFVNSPAHLRSSEAGNKYKLRVTSNQRLDSAPTSLVASAGVLSGSWTQKNSSVWETEISIRDIDPRGAQNFHSLAITGIAGVVANAIEGGADFTIQGFLMREVVVPALSQKVAIGTSVTDPANVRASYKGADKLTYHADLAKYQAGFSVVDVDGTFNAKGDHLWISDSDFAGTNTSGTLILTVEEV